MLRGNPLMAKFPKYVAEDLGIDLSKSWMIGDSPRDVQAGKAAGCRTILLGEAEPSEEQPDQPADSQQAEFRAENLLEAAEIIIQQDMGSAREQQSWTTKPLRQKPTKIELFHLGNVFDRALIDSPVSI